MVMRLGLQNEGVKVVRGKNATAAGTTTVYSTSVSLDQYDFLAAILCLGAVVDAAGGFINWQQSINNTDFFDLKGTKKLIADADDNHVLLTEVIRPQVSLGKWLRLAIVRGGAQNITLDSIVYLLCNGRTAPAPSDATAFFYGHSYYNSPDLGTP